MPSVFTFELLSEVGVCTGDGERNDWPTLQNSLEFLPAQVTRYKGAIRSVSDGHTVDRQNLDVWHLGSIQPERKYRSCNRPKVRSEQTDSITAEDRVGLLPKMAFLEENVGSWRAPKLRISRIRESPRSCRGQHRLPANQCIWLTVGSVCCPLKKRVYLERRLPTFAEDMKTASRRTALARSIKPPSVPELCSAHR